MYSGIVYQDVDPICYGPDRCNRTCNTHGTGNIQLHRLSIYAALTKRAGCGFTFDVVTTSEPNAIITFAKLPGDSKA